MKSIVVFVLALVATQPSLGQGSCSERVAICPGMTVFPSNYDSGSAKVIAINPASSIVTVKGDGSISYDRYTVDDLALPIGCANGICIGKSVVPSNYDSGVARLIAINPHTQILTVMGDGAISYDRYTVEDLATTWGCVDGICVRDVVFPSNYDSGSARVVAVNRYTRIITVIGDGAISYDRYTSADLSITQICQDYGIDIRNRSRRK